MGCTYKEVTVDLGTIYFLGETAARLDGNETRILAGYVVLLDPVSYFIILLMTMYQVNGEYKLACSSLHRISCNLLHRLNNPF